MKIAREMAAGKRPLMFEEKPRPVGKGGAAFKSLTAAVKAAERERDEARALKVACDEVLTACSNQLKRMEGEVARVRRWLQWDAVVCAIMFGLLVVFIWWHKIFLTCMC